MANYGKITSKVTHHITGVVRSVKEVSNENGVSILHTLESAYEEFDGDKSDRTYLNWQFWTRSSGDKSAMVYEEGSVVTLTFKYFKITPSENGRSFYLVPQFPKIERLDWVTVEKYDKDKGGDEAPKYNKSSNKGNDNEPEPQGQWDF